MSFFYSVNKLGIILYDEPSGVNLGETEDNSMFLQGEEAWNLLERLEEQETTEGEERLIAPYFD